MNNLTNVKFLVLYYSNYWLSQLKFFRDDIKYKKIFYFLNTFFSFLFISYIIYIIM